MIKIKNIDIFSPYIIAIVILVFLCMGYIGSFNYRFENPLSEETILLVLYSILVFSIGVYLTKKFIKFDNLNIKKENLKLISDKLLVITIIIALILQVINLVQIGGIPLFNSVLKSNATTDIWRISYLLFLVGINLLIAKYYEKKYLILIILGLGLFTLNGYRTSIMGILISLFISFYYIGKINLKVFTIFIITILSLGLAIGFIASQSIAGQVWLLNPFELVFYRSAFTLEVLEKIIPLGGSTNGEILKMIFSTGSPRTFIGEYVLHYHALITSTIFGPVYLDYGIIGLTIQMLFFGIFLKLVHIVQKNIKGIAIGIYAILLAHTLIWIETGPTDIMIWLLFILGLIIIILNRKKLSVQK